MYEIVFPGDLNANGYIDNGETPITQPFILWSPGPDGLFSPAGEPPQAGNVTLNKKLVNKCDDVMNIP